MGDRQEALLQLSEVLEDEYASHELLFDMMPELRRDADVISLVRAYS
jgi:hypothetical protein